MEFEYSNSFISTSPTLREVAGAALENACHKAVAYDENGNVVLASSGEKAMGLLLSTTANAVSAGDEVDILVKDVGLLISAEPIAKGDFVTIENGLGKVACEGDFIFGRAVTASSGTDESFQVRIGAFGGIMPSFEE